MRRLLAIWIAGCLAAGFFYRATPSVLVCRLTGTEMAPVVAETAEAKDAPSCCLMAETTQADGHPAYTLTAPGCCDLVSAPTREHPPATLAATDVTLPTAIWGPIVIAIPIPPTMETVALPPVARASAPRAPPLRSVPSRGPPYFS